MIRDIESSVTPTSRKKAQKNKSKKTATAPDLKRKSRKRAKSTKSKKKKSVPEESVEKQQMSRRPQATEKEIPLFSADPICVHRRGGEYPGI